MKRPWMPLYIADYLRKTTHLGALESGAYLHLIMDYWQNDGLPDDDKKLARIAKMTDREWKAAKATLQAFFHDGWKHEKIDEEIAKAVEISGKRSAIATARQAAIREQQESKQSAIAPPIADTLHTTQEVRKKDAADAAPVDPEVELFRRGREVLGKQAGGLISNLLKAKNKNVALARAAIEQASTKSDPREYVGRIINGQKPGETAWLGGVEGII
jgi:uncharacterized protein YdaU (DUF1376 family)